MQQGGGQLGTASWRDARRDAAWLDPFSDLTAPGRAQPILHLIKWLFFRPHIASRPSTTSYIVSKFASNLFLIRAERWVTVHVSGQVTVNANHVCNNAH